MKKILSIICAISILMSVLIIPSAVSISAEDVATSDLGVAVDLVPTLKENIIVEETTDEEGNVTERLFREPNADLGESGAWGKHSMTFDYQIEAGYTYVMEFDYIGNLVSGASYTEPVSISGVNSPQGYVGGYPAEHIVVGLTNSTSWKTDAKFAFSGDEFLKSGKPYLCFFWWCIEGVKPQFKNITITKLAQMENEIVPEKIKEVDYAIEDGDVVYKGYPNWGSGSMTFDYKIEAGYNYYLVYEYRGHDWFNKYAPAANAVATDETITTGEHTTGYIALGIPQSKTAFTTKYVKLDGDALLTSGGSYLMIDWVGCTPENVADFKNIRIVKEAKGSNDITAVKSSEVITDIVDNRWTYKLKTEGGWYNPAITTDVELEADKKYIVKFDYKMNSTDQSGLYFGLSSSATSAHESTITQEWRFSLPAKTWETAFIVIDTTGKDLTTNKYLGFKSPINGKNFELYFSNLTVEEYTGTELLPTAVKFNETFLGIDGEELYIEIDSTFNTYTSSAFTTNVELEADKKYIVSYDYKLTGTVKRQWFGLTADPSTGNSGSKVWALNGFKATDSWKAGAMIIDTTGMDLSTAKYFSFNSEHSGNPVDLKLANLAITELTTDTIIPTTVKPGEMFLAAENGTPYWYCDVPSESYQNPCFTTDYEVESGKVYAVTFDYKLQHSFVTGTWFSVIADTTSAEQGYMTDIQKINLNQAADWTECTILFDTRNAEGITDTNKYFAFHGAALWGKPKMSMKNLKIEEITVDGALPVASDKFTTKIEDGEVVMNYSETTGAGEYDTVGFTTDVELENGKEYIVAFDYKYNGVWFNDAFRAVSTGTTWDESRLRGGQMVDIFKVGNAATDWTQAAAGFVAATDETNTNLGFAAMANENATYELSIKGIKLYDNGDVNLDNNVDGSDITLLKKSLLGADAQGAAFTNISLDAEKDTNILDLVAMKKILAAKTEVAE